MEKIQHGSYVEIIYDLYEIGPDGTETLVHQVDTDAPDRLVIGVTPGLVDPLVTALTGLSKGDSFDVSATAEQAFGNRSDEFIMELEKAIFEVNGHFDAEMVYPGEVLPMVTADGFKVQGRVLEVGDKWVKMDFNHPLAGSPVRFKGKVLFVREATPEELQSTCCGCGDGDSHDCGKGSGCGNGCCGKC